MPKKYYNFKKHFFQYAVVISLVSLSCLVNPAMPFLSASGLDKDTINEKIMPKSEDYKEYLRFFREIYRTMNENYYYPVHIENFNRFINKFDKDIYGKLQSEGKTINYIKWRSSAYLVDYLKDAEDTFSAFFPPKPAQEFEEEVLGKRVDLGIEGELTPKGFLISHIEPRSDAYEKGLRQDDIILSIDDVFVSTLQKEEIEKLLMPLIDTTVRLEFFDASENRQAVLNVLSKEYFKQTVFLVPVDVPGVFCLAIKSFNRKTSEDMFRFLKLISNTKGSSLILDLRGNPGGPPLAAREISSFFLTPQKEFAYFQKKDKPKASLDVPQIPEQYRYKGPVAILVDEKSGSASELFSGVMQKSGRAVLVGKNTAGRVFLKSMFHFDDESMLLLVTARGHFSDGEVFDFKGLTPDFPLEGDNVDLINFAAHYLHALKVSRAQEI